MSLAKEHGAVAGDAGVKIGWVELASSLSDADLLPRDFVWYEATGFIKSWGSNSVSGTTPVLQTLMSHNFPSVCNAILPSVLCKPGIFSPVGHHPDFGTNLAASLGFDKIKAAGVYAGNAVTEALYWNRSTRSTALVVSTGVV